LSGTGERLFGALPLEVVEDLEPCSLGMRFRQIRFQREGSLHCFAGSLEASSDRRPPETNFSRVRNAQFRPRESEARIQHHGVLQIRDGLRRAVATEMAQEVARL